MKRITRLCVVKFSAMQICRLIVVVLINVNSLFTLNFQFLFFFRFRTQHSMHVIHWQAAQCENVDGLWSLIFFFFGSHDSNFFLLRMRKNFHLSPKMQSREVNSLVQGVFACFFKSTSDQNCNDQTVDSNDTSHDNCERGEKMDDSQLSSYDEIKIFAIYLG